MPIDMKKKIAEAALRLLTEKKARKLTVKDIVEECHITRQSFYYHFEDIPDLLRWVLEQGLERMMEETQAKENGEESIRYFFLMAVNAMPYVRKTMESNYGEEMEHLLRQQIFRLFEEGCGRSAPVSELQPVGAEADSAVSQQRRHWSAAGMDGRRYQESGSDRPRGLSADYGRHFSFF